jgi:hypothetical protein
LSNGKFKISLSLRVSYDIATPLVGFAEDNYHGGSTVTTSKCRPVILNYSSASFAKSNVRTSTESGTPQKCFRLADSLKL